MNYPRMLYCSTSRPIVVQSLDQELQHTDRGWSTTPVPQVDPMAAAKKEIARLTEENETLRKAFTILGDKQTTASQSGRPLGPRQRKPKGDQVP